MIDLILHSGTKFALESWLAARGLGVQTQDTGPTSPTFGAWSYAHTAPGMFYYWRYPSGKLEKTAPVYSGQTLVTPGTFYAGFFALLRFPGPEIPIETWVRNNTATSILDGFAGYGGEGVTLLNPDDVNAKMDTIGMPRHEMVGGCTWSDPNMWWLGPVMKNTERTYKAKVYKSLIDYNVWNPDQYPAGWELIGAAPPEVEAWVQPTGGHDDYQIGDRVLFNGSVYESKINANVWSPAVYPAGWQLIP